MTWKFPLFYCKACVPLYILLKCHLLEPVEVLLPESHQTALSPWRKGEQPLAFPRHQEFSLWENGTNQLKIAWFILQRAPYIQFVFSVPRDLFLFYYPHASFLSWIVSITHPRSKTENLLNMFQAQITGGHWRVVDFKYKLGWSSDFVVKKTKHLVNSGAPT